ncbi:unnamed protein product [Lepeophtheirus salmonis]|uniref:(salmon louse) hypothetical protein n=1 Tax=Lepeophtheirus salmonis TaxID=72036 RepID=A0A7R8CN29_LEPSM|nr:unnamed protein product [Lepeophtheirus salmonis]CAF2871135.1 unnamed protein product [Lepeophtheirus salmonis]
MHNDSHEEKDNTSRVNGTIGSQISKDYSLEEFLKETDHSTSEDHESEKAEEVPVSLHGQDKEKNQESNLAFDSNCHIDSIGKYTHLIKFGLSCVLSYFIGFFEWSILWIILALTIFTIYLHKKHKKKLKTFFAYDIATRGEEKALQCRFSELPSWVQFSDINRVEWINTVISVIWPHVSYFMDYFLRHSVEPLAREALEQYKLWDFKFQQIDFGKIPPRICGVKVHGEPGSSEIIIDVDFEYNGDIDVSISVLKISSSVADVQIQGRLRIVLKPIIEDIPFIAGIQIFFLTSPEIDFDLGGAASILDLPGLNTVIKQSLNDYIERYAVLPNKISILLSDKISPVELKMPQPVGIVTILPESQDLNVTVFDSDMGSSDDFSGSTKVNIQSIVKNGKIDEWIPLNNVPSGSIHLKLSWSQVRLEPLPDNEILNHSALLCIFLDSASVGDTLLFPAYYSNHLNETSVVKFTIFDDRREVSVSNGSFSISSVATFSRKNFKIANYKLNDSESSVSFAAQVQLLDKTNNIKGLGSSATGAARDVSGYAKNVKSVTGTAIKNLGTAASNKTKNLSSTLRRKEDITDGATRYEHYTSIGLNE